MTWKEVQTSHGLQRKILTVCNAVEEFLKDIKIFRHTIIYSCTFSKLIPGTLGMKRENTLDWDIRSSEQHLAAYRHVFEKQEGKGEPNGQTVITLSMFKKSEIEVTWKEAKI